MIANLLNTLVGLVLVYAAVLEPTWVQQQYFPLLIFAAIILVLAVWGRFSDPMGWFSWVNMVLAVALGVLALFPLATLTFSNVAFWGSFWVGCAVPVVALWSALYRHDLRKRVASAVPG